MCKLGWSGDNCDQCVPHVHCPNQHRLADGSDPDGDPINPCVKPWECICSKSHDDPLCLCTPDDSNPTTTTTYFVRGEGGCVVAGPCGSITVTVQGIDATVTNNGNSLVSNQTGAQYQWVDCDNGNTDIPGATQQTYVPTEIIGNYAVVVTIGSCSESSNCELVDFTSVEELNGNAVLIYPNPAADFVKIDWKGELNAIRLTDSKGKLLKVINNPAGQT